MITTALWQSGHMYYIFYVYAKLVAELSQMCIDISHIINCDVTPDLYHIDALTYLLERLYYKHAAYS